MMSSKKSEADDSRASERRKYLRTGKIVFNHGTSTMGCAVFDLSATGARLRPEELSLVPDSFELQVVDGPVFQCEVVHKEDGQLGVQFV